MKDCGISFDLKCSLDTSDTKVWLKTRDLPSSEFILDPMILHQSHLGYGDNSINSVQVWFRCWARLGFQVERIGGLV